MAICKKGFIHMVVNMNMTFLVGLFFYFLIFGGLIYYLCKRKTTTPIIATLIGIVLCIFPPLSIVYIIVLVLKNDVVPSSNIKTSV